MKKLVLFSVVAGLLICTTNVKSQIKMDCNGHIGLGKEPDSFWDIDINANTRINGSVYNYGPAWSYDRAGFYDNVGIGFGLPGPPYRLVVDGGHAWFYQKVYVKGYAYLYENVGIGGAASSSYDLYVHGGRSYIKGCAGIGVSPSSAVATLKVGGGSESTSIYTYGDIKINGASVLVSDKRYKKDINSITNPLETLIKIDGRTYEFKNQDELKKLYENKKLKFYLDTIYNEVDKNVSEPKVDSAGNSVLSNYIEALASNKN